MQKPVAAGKDPHNEGRVFVSGTDGNELTGQRKNAIAVGSSTLSALTSFGKCNDEKPERNEESLAPGRRQAGRCWQPGKTGYLRHKGGGNVFAIRPGKTVIPAPKDGACRVCGEIHGRGEAHNRDSLLYQHKFRMNHGRYPTWEDAMGHCGKAARDRMIKRLARHGIHLAEDQKPDGWEAGRANRAGRNSREARKDGRPKGLTPEGRKAANGNAAPKAGTKGGAGNRQRMDP